MSGSRDDEAMTDQPTPARWAKMGSEGDGGQPPNSYRISMTSSVKVQ